MYHISPSRVMSCACYFSKHLPLVIKPSTVCSCLAPTALNSASKDSTPLEYTDKLAQILTSAMAEGKPMIHLVTVKVMKPFRMFICTECHCDICDFVLRFGYFAPIESMIFHHILTQGSGCTNSDALVVDAGANVGYFSLLAAAYGCRVVAFEPNVKARLYLEASAALHEDNLVEVHSQALGEKNGSVELEEATIWGLNKIVITNGTQPKLQTEVEATNKSGPLRGDVEKISSNITSRSFSQAVGGRNAPVMPTIPNSQTGIGRKLQIEVETIQLDSIAQESILLFKIDTEGFEPHILAGSMSVIKQKGVQHIVMEVKDRGLKAIREMLWRLMIEGDFPFVYNYQEFYLGKQDHSGQYLPIEKYDLGTENIVDVSDIILNQKNDATMYEDFWFTKERLPWLTPG